MDIAQKKEILMKGITFAMFLQNPIRWKDAKELMLFSIKVPTGFNDHLKRWYNHPSMKEVIEDIDITEIESQIASDIFIIGITTLFSDEKINKKMSDYITGVLEYGLKKETQGN